MNKRKPLTAAHKEKLRLAKLKKPVSYWLGKKRNVSWLSSFKKGHVPWNKGKTGLQSDENHPLWKGDKVSYVGLHQWVRRKKGKPSICEYCKSTKNLQWANVSYCYKRDTDDYISLCSSCHKKRDLAGDWGAGKNRRTLYE